MIDLANTDEMNEVAQGWIVVPAYREELGIGKFLEDLNRVCLQFPSSSIEFTVLIVNDGSPDATKAVVDRAARDLARPGFKIKCVSLIRNFGHQAALISGLTAASEAGCHFALTMDADGEHPVTLIPELIKEWRLGAPIVHTVRASKDLKLFKKLSSNLFYSLMRSTGFKIRAGMADFKIWDGELLRQVADFLPRCGSVRLFASWLSPNSSMVHYEQKVVEGRESRFTFRKMLSFALMGFFNYQDFLIRGVTVVGSMTVLISFVVSVYTLISFQRGLTIPGWTSLSILIAFFGGVQMISIGILSEYFNYRVFRKNLPLYVNARDRD
jgi:dolichol-phosphate mannosyltransferase